VVDNKKHQKPAHKLRRFFVHNKWPLIIVSLIILVSVAGGGFVYFNSLNVKESAQPKLTNRDEISIKADSIVKDEGYKAAGVFLDNELSKTDDSTIQSHLYINKALLASSPAGGSDESKALEYSLRAEELSPDEETAQMIAVHYENLGDLTNAIKYYKIYLSRLPDGSAGSLSSDYDYYQIYVSELEAALVK